MNVLIDTNDIPFIIVVLFSTAIYCVYNMYQLKNIETHDWRIICGLIPFQWRYSVWYKRIFLVIDAIICFPYRFFYFISYYLYLIAMLVFLYIRQYIERIKAFFGINKK